MSTFTRLIKFETQDGRKLWTDVGDQDIGSLKGTTVNAYPSVGPKGCEGAPYQVVVHKLLAPVPNPNLPIYCVGLNYRTHAKEAGLDLPNNPPLWLKPAAALANPGEDIPINKFCAKSLPDYEGELTFITSKSCKDISVEEASDYILGYTIGNDISCRLHQAKEEQGGQFFYAKAFDKFAPMGPCLVHPTALKAARLTTLKNHVLLQDVDTKEDMVFSPARILSHMSQGTTIPAGTAVMTGTPAGVGYFQDPKQLLKDGDVVEVSVSGIGTLKNRIVFL